MRLVWIKAGVYDVLAIADRRGDGVLEHLETVDSSHQGAIDMRALLEGVVPEEGPLSDQVRSRPLGNGLFEFKTWDVRVLWFYAGNTPGVRRGIVCSHWCHKQPKKSFNENEVPKARRAKKRFEADRDRGSLIIPQRPERKP